MYGQTQIFPLFSPYLGSLAAEAVAFAEISSLHTLHYVLCMVTLKSFIISPFSLARWYKKQWQLSKFRHFHLLCT